MAATMTAGTTAVKTTHEAYGFRRATIPPPDDDCRDSAGPGDYRVPPPAGQTPSGPKEPLRHAGGNARGARCAGRPRSAKVTRGPDVPGAQPASAAEEALFMENKPPQEIQLRARIDDSVAEGIYVNFGSIVHNRSEFILDLGRIVPGKPEVKILTRVLTTPLHAKQLCRALAQNIEQYEKMFGEITGVDDVSKRVGF